VRLGIVVLATLLAAPALAQLPPGSVSGSAAQVELARRQQQVRLMERALEEAVARGVRTVEQQLPSVPGGRVLCRSGSSTRVRARGLWCVL